MVLRSAASVIVVGTVVIAAGIVALGVAGRSICRSFLWRRISDGVSTVVQSTVIGTVTVIVTVTVIGTVTVNVAEEILWEKLPTLT